MNTKPVLFAGLAAVLVLGLGAPASAQVWGGRDRDDRAYRQDDYSRQAYDNGYRRGMDRGERDGRSHRTMNYRDDRDYRNGDWGYNDRYGPRDYYRDSFRRGFEAGYRAGYSRYYGGGYDGRAVPGYGYPDRYPNDGRYGTYGGYNRYGYAGNIGYRNGYNDGIEKGREDTRKHRSYDILRHGWYRGGDRHYEREYGPKDLYRNAYREGFKQGYDAAYRGGYRW